MKLAKLPDIELKLGVWKIMINTVTIVGKIFSEPEIVVTKDNVLTKWVKFVLAVERPFKNRNNEYENDFITIKTWMINIEGIKNKLKINNVVCVKARVQSFTNGIPGNIHHLELIAEKIVVW